MATTVEILAKVTADTSQFQRQMQGASDAVGGAGSRMQAVAGGMTKAGKTLTAAVTLPLVGIGIAAVKTSMDFEASMAKIVGLVGIAADEVDAMRDSVLAMATETGKAPQELADALFVITSAGLRGSEALEALESAARAGSAGLGETNDIARALAGAMNAYGSEVLSAAEATDVIVATARAGNFETSQFAGAIGRVLPFAKQAGASFADMGGAVALLTRTNGDAAQSVTQMAALFRAFVVPTEQAKVALADVGMSAEDLRASIADRGLPATLQMLDDALGGNREQLGRLLGSSEAASAAFQILDADAATLEATFGEVSDAAGITDEAFGAAADTGAFKLQRAMATFKATLIEIGNIIGPFVEKAADGFAALVGKFGDMSPEGKNVAVAIAAIAAAIGPVLLIVGKLISAVMAAKGVIMAIAGVLGIAGIKIVAIIAIIAGLVAAFVAVWNSSENFRNAVVNAFNAIRDAVMHVVDTVKGKLAENADAINVIKAVFQGIVDFMSAYVIPFFSNYVANMFRGIGDAIGFLIDVSSRLIMVYKKIGEVVLRMGSMIIRGFATIVDMVLAGVQTLIQTLADWFGWVPGGVGDALRSAADSVTGFRDSTSQNMNNVAATLENTANDFANFGESAEDGAAAAEGGMRQSAAAIENSAGQIEGAADGAATALINLSEAIAAFNGEVTSAQAADQLITTIRGLGEAASEFAGNLNGTSNAAIEFRGEVFNAINQVNSTISTMGLEGQAAEQMFTDSMKKIVRQMRDNGIKGPDIRKFLAGLGMAPELIAEIMGNAKGASRQSGVDLVAATTDGINSGVDSVTEAGSGLVSSYVMGMEGVAGEAAVTGQQLIDNTVAGIQGSIGAVENAGAAVATDAVEAGTSEAQRTAALVGAEMTATTAAGMMTTQYAVSAAFITVVSNALFAVRGLAVGGATAIGLAISFGIAQGIRNGQSAAIAAAIAVARAALAAAKRELGIESPSKRFSEVGQDSTRGFVEGLEKDMLGVQRRVSTAFDRMVSGVTVGVPSVGVPAAAPTMMRAAEPSVMESRRGGIVIENFNVSAADGERAETSVPRALRRLAWVAGLDG